MRQTDTVLKQADVVNVFLDGARVVVAAIADPAVDDAWDGPSVLEEQLVSSLVGHLARGGVWVVGDYLDAGTPGGAVDFDSAGEYFAAFAGSASPDDHRSVRDRGAAVASVGQDELLRTLRERLSALEPRLHALDPAHRITVTAGKVMRLNDYLATRIVEQSVHLDDLARSVGRDPWPISADAQALTIQVGTEIARRRSGTSALIRALYRQGFAEPTLPVL
jgi:hypothetical protein